MTPAMLTEDEIVEIGARAHFYAAGRVRYGKDAPDWHRHLTERNREQGRTEFREFLSRLREAGLEVEQGWRFDMENAPIDEPLILATTGEHVGEAIRDIEGDDGSWFFRWARSGTPLHPNLRPVAWRPLPAPPAKDASQ